MKKFFNENDGDVELNMQHGEHIAAIYPLNEFFENEFKYVIRDSKLHLRNYTNVKIDNSPEIRTEVSSLKYGDGDISFLSLIAYEPLDDVNSFLSIYPTMKGCSTKVTIEKVIEWDNLIEATVFASCEDFEFAFFAVDYYQNKEKYRVGKSLNVDLAALALYIKEADNGFTFEGEKAVSWYEKIGQKPIYNDRGEVEPVRFKTDTLVVFLSMDPKSPDIAQFQSPSRTSNDFVNLLDRDFRRAEITIKRFDNDEELNIPLYYYDDPDNPIQKDSSLIGVLWLTGSVSE